MLRNDIAWRGSRSKWEASYCDEHYHKCPIWIQRGALVYVVRASDPIEQAPDCCRELATYKEILLEVTCNALWSDIVSHEMKLLDKLKKLAARSSRSF